MRLSLRVAAALLPAVVAGACDPYACRYKTRFVSTTGSATRADIGTVSTEYVNFRDYEEGETAPRSLTWSIRSSDLVAQPKRLTLRDGRDTTTIVAHLGIAGTAGQLSYGSHDLVAPADREAMFRRLSGGHGVLILEAQNTAVLPLVVRLVPATVQGWYRQQCS